MEAFDVQKTRKVLERVEKFLGILIRENLVKDAPFLDEGELENESDLADDVWEVLQTQLRQCDVGTAEEQIKRWVKFCQEHHEYWKPSKSLTAIQRCNCPCYEGNGCNYFIWAQMPYEEGGAE